MTDALSRRLLELLGPITVESFVELMRILGYRVTITKGKE